MYILTAAEIFKIMLCQHSLNRPTWTFSQQVYHKLKAMYNSIFINVAIQRSYLPGIRKFLHIVDMHLSSDQLKSVTNILMLNILMLTFIKLTLSFKLSIKIHNFNWKIRRENIFTLCWHFLMREKNKDLKSEYNVYWLYIVITWIHLYICTTRVNNHIWHGQYEMK